jgi:hypothetical protein
MIYQKRGQWCVRIDGQLRKFATEAEAKKAAGLVEKSSWMQAKESLVEAEVEPAECEECECDPCECEDLG